MGWSLCAAAALRAAALHQLAPGAQYALHQLPPCSAPVAIVLLGNSG